MLVVLMNMMVITHPLISWSSIYGSKGFMCKVQGDCLAGCFQA